MEVETRDAEKEPFHPAFQVTTDENGRFACSPVASGLLIVTARQEHEISKASIVTFDSRSAAETLVLELEPAISIRVVVSDDATGLPLEGATVEVNAVGSLVSGPSDESGVVTVYVKSVSPNTVLTARKKGYGPRDVRVTVPDHNNTASVSIALTSGCTISGRVHDSAGMAIQGAIVVAVSVDPEKPDWVQAVTGASGAFVIADVRRDAAHSLAVERGGYGTLIYDLPEASTGPCEVDLGGLLMQQGCSIRAKVASANGTGIAGLHVRLLGTNDDRGAKYVAKPHPPVLFPILESQSRVTDDEGTAVFADVAPGTYDIMARDPDGIATASAAVDARSTRGTIDVAIDWVDSSRITGRVVTSAGEGLSGVYLQATLSDTVGSEGIAMQRATTDLNGYFELRRLRAGTHTIALAGSCRPELDSWRGIVSGTYGLVLSAHCDPASYPRR